MASEKHREWITWDPAGAELLNLCHQAGLNDTQVCQRMGVSQGYFSSARSRGKIAALGFNALRGVVAEMTAPSQTVVVNTGMSISVAEAELIFVMCSLMRGKLSSREAEILALQKRMAGRVAG